MKERRKWIAPYPKKSRVVIKTMAVIKEWRKIDSILPKKLICHTKKITYSYDGTMTEALTKEWKIKSHCPRKPKPQRVVHLQGAASVERFLYGSTVKKFAKVPSRGRESKAPRIWWSSVRDFTWMRKKKILECLERNADSWAKEIK